MIDGLRSYPEMKESGLPWLGDVPAHWEALRSKYVFREVDRRSTTGEETHLSMSQRLGLIAADQVEQRTLVSESYAGGKLVEENDLVLNRLKAHLGVFAHARQHGVVSPDYTVLRPCKRMSVRFFEFVLRSPACRVELRTRAKGIVEGFWRLYTDDFYAIYLPVPPTDEQRLIVQFLDWHGARTAKLIHTKKRLIALLNEQKQSIIHCAVTRGLDPNVELKPSGIPWIGDIPAHWDVLSMGAVSRLIQTGPFGSQLPASAYSRGGVPVVNPSHLVGGAVTPETDVAVSEETARRLERHRFSVGDLAVARRGELGRCAVIGEQETGWICGTGTIRLSPRNDRIEPRFCALLFGDPLLRSDLKIASIGATMDNVNEGMIARLQVPLPPRCEQHSIIEHTGRITVVANRAVQVVEREIVLIQEFRTRLIADVVTGKLDVRAIAASLPDVAGLEPIDEAAEEDGLDEEAMGEAGAEDVAA